MIPQYRVREVASTGMWMRTLCTNLGRIVHGGLWTCDPRCRLWQEVSQMETVDADRRCRVWGRDVTLETVDL